MQENWNQQNWMCSRTSSTIHCSWWFLYWQLPFKCCVSNLVDSHWKQFHWLKENTWFVLDWDLCQSLLASSLNFSFLPVFSISLLHQLNHQMKNMKNDRLIFIHELYLIISKFNVLLSDNIKTIYQIKLTTFYNQSIIKLE